VGGTCRRAALPKLLRRPGLAFRFDSAAARSQLTEMRRPLPPELVVAIPTYRRLHKFIGASLRLLRKSPELLPQTRVYLQCAEDASAFVEAQAQGLIPASVTLVQAKRKGQWVSGFAEIMHYIRTHLPKGTPIVFLHDDVRAVYHCRARGEKRRRTTVSAFAREAWHACSGEIGSMVGVAPTKLHRRRSNPSVLSGVPLFVYDPLHLEVNSKDIPPCHFRSKCDYEASLLAYLLGHPVHQLIHYSVASRHTPLANTQGGIVGRKQSDQVRESLAMQEVFHPLITDFLWRAGGYTSFRLCGAHAAQKLSDEDKAEVLERYRMKARVG